jgi:hypothetical protein
MAALRRSGAIIAAMRPALATALVLTVAAAPALATTRDAAAPDVPGREVYVEPSPLAGLIDALPHLPEEARVDLVASILDAQVAAYEAELDQAMDEFQRRGAGRADLARWSAAIAPILEELRAAQADLLIARRVAVSIDRHNQVLLMIDDRPLWVAWPRISARNRLERELATEFCLRHDCPAELLEGAGARAVAPSAAPGTWRLAQFQPPTWESIDGVHCEFRDASRLGEKERICRDIVADLHVLAAALRAARRGGEQIEWQHLGMRPDTSGGQHRVIVNARGDYIAVYVPALAAQPIEWRGAGRWLEARLDGNPASAIVLRAVPGGAGSPR